MRKSSTLARGVGVPRGTMLGVVLIVVLAALMLWIVFGVMPGL